jgi:acyl carrier protein
MSFVKTKYLLAKILACPPEEISENCAMGVHPRWDSLAHMRLLVTLEEEYNIEITDNSIEQLINFENLELLLKGKES